MKLWQVLAIVALLVLVSVTGWVSQQAVNGIKTNSLAVSTVSPEFSADNIYLRPEDGQHAYFEVGSGDGQRINVYFTNASNRQDFLPSRPFDYDPEHSQLNTTYYQTEVWLSDTSDIYEVVITGVDPQATVPVYGHSEQSSWPLGLRPVFQALSLVAWISNLALFVLLIYAISSYASERSRSDLGGPRTSPLSWADRHPRAWIASTVLSFALAGVCVLFPFLASLGANGMLLVLVFGLCLLAVLVLGVIASALVHQRPEGRFLPTLAGTALACAGIAGLLTMVGQAVLLQNAGDGGELLSSFVAFQVFLAILQFAGAVLAFTRFVWPAAFVIALTGLFIGQGFGLLALIFLWYGRERFAGLSGSARPV
jgi:hypothetical protein